MADADPQRDHKRYPTLWSGIVFALQAPDKAGTPPTELHPVPSCPFLPPLPPRQSARQAPQAPAAALSPPHPPLHRPTFKMGMAAILGCAHFCIISGRIADKTLIMCRFAALRKKFFRFVARKWATKGRRAGDGKSEPEGGAPPSTSKGIPPCRRLFRCRILWSTVSIRSTPSCSTVCC